VGASHRVGRRPDRAEPVALRGRQRTAQAATVRAVSAELAALQLDRCLRLPIELHGDARLHARALEIASERHLSATYDAHYIALAERFRVPLWTSDHRLAGALGDGLPEVHLVP